MDWYLRGIEIIMARIDPLVWKAQRFGSKTEIGLFFYAIGAFLAGGSNLYNVLLIGLFYVWREWPLLRWAWKHADEPIRGAVPMEYVDLMLNGFRNMLIGGTILVTSLIVCLVILSAPPSESYVPSEFTRIVFLAGIVPGWLFPLGFFSMALGYFVLACPPRPRSERFSFTRWLKERRARVPTPVRLEIRR